MRTSAQTRCPQPVCAASLGENEIIGSVNRRMSNSIGRRNPLIAPFLMK